MADDKNSSDRANRLILIALLILAIVTIGGTIISTMGAWDAGEGPAAEESQ